MRTRDEVYIGHSTDPWVKAGIGRGLLWLFWRPSWAIFLFVLAVAAIGTLLQRSATALVLVAVTGRGGPPRPTSGSFEYLGSTFRRSRAAHSHFALGPSAKAEPLGAIRPLGCYRPQAGGCQRWMP